MLTFRWSRWRESWNHGVNAKFVKEVETLGYGAAPLEQLVRMQDRGVTPRFIKELKELGFENVTIEQLLRMQDYGVNAARSSRRRARSASTELRLRN